MTNRKTIIETPYRSPMAVVNKIKPYIKDKVVCELGSAYGDISLEMAKYAKRVIGVEIDPERVLVSRQRGLETICADATGSYELPCNVDVYYIWMGSDISRKVFTKIKSGLVIM